MPAVTICPGPIIHDENPFYSPSFPVFSFLQSFRQNLYTEANTHRHSSAHTPDFPHDVHHLHFPSFNNLPGRFLDGEDLLRLYYCASEPRQDLPLTSNTTGPNFGISPLHFVSNAKERAGSHAHRFSHQFSVPRSSRPTRVAETSDSFGGFQGPFKRQ